jgi:threonine aldolase
MENSVISQVRRDCTRFLVGHYRKSPQQTLSELAATTDPDVAADTYGQGAVIADFEDEIAHLLGKEAAVFMPSGTMCQQIALRIWSERKGKPRVAFHPTCHLEIYEQQGYRELHHLQGVLVGSAERLMTLADLQAIAQPLAALLIELPQREIGGQLPTWEELASLTSWAREQGMALHLDGARLWQCGAYYARSYAEIAALFDSVYVSFYKDLAGIAGAVLAGSADFIAAARVWQRRHGGNLVQLYPYVLAAKLGMQRHLDRMPAYAEKARAIALALANCPDLAIIPHLPPTNMMHLYLRGDQEALLEAAMAVSRATGIFTIPWLRSTVLPQQQVFEWTVGEATLDVATEEIVTLFQDIFARVRG